MKKLLIIAIPIALLIAILISISSTFTEKYNVSEQAYMEDLSKEEDVIEIGPIVSYQEIMVSLSQAEYFIVIDSNNSDAVVDETVAETETVTQTQTETDNNSDTSATSESTSSSESESSSKAPSISLDPNITYRVASIQFNAPSDKQKYRPKINIYLETVEDSSSGTWSIKQILAASVDPKYNDLNLKFKGHVYYNLEDSNKIYWSINGDFYEEEVLDPKNIQVNFTDGNNITIGKKDNLNHFSYIYKEGRITID